MPGTPEPPVARLLADGAALELALDGDKYRISAELLRAYSPSVDNRRSPTPPSGKRGVRITALAAVGNYALRPGFSDGHNSGIYNWGLLRRLGARGDTLWRLYLRRLHRARLSREAGARVVCVVDPAADSAPGGAAHPGAAHGRDAT